MTDAFAIMESFACPSAVARWKAATLADVITKNAPPEMRGAIYLGAHDKNPSNPTAYVRTAVHNAAVDRDRADYVAGMAYVPDDHRIMCVDHEDARISTGRVPGAVDDSERHAELATARHRIYRRDPVDPGDGAKPTYSTDALATRSKTRPGTPFVSGVRIDPKKWDWSKDAPDHAKPCTCPNCRALFPVRLTYPHRRTRRDWRGELESPVPTRTPINARPLTSGATYQYDAAEDAIIALVEHARRAPRVRDVAVALGHPHRDWSLVAEAFDHYRAEWERGIAKVEALAREAGARSYTAVPVPVRVLFYWFSQDPQFRHLFPDDSPVTLSRVAVVSGLASKWRLERFADDRNLTELERQATKAAGDDLHERLLRRIADAEDYRKKIDSGVPESVAAKRLVNGRSDSAGLPSRRMSRGAK